MVPPISMRVESYPSPMPSFNTPLSCPVSLPYREFAPGGVSGSFCNFPDSLPGVGPFDYRVLLAPGRSALSFPPTPVTRAVRLFLLYSSPVRLPRTDFSVDRSPGNERSKDFRFTIFFDPQRLRFSTFPSIPRAFFTSSFCLLRALCR